MEKKDTFKNYKLHRDILNQMDQKFRSDVIQIKRREFRSKVMENIVNITDSNDLLKEPKQRSNLSRSPKKRRVVEEFVYRLSDKGYCYTGRKTISKKVSCHVDTVDEGIRILKETGLFFWTYLQNPDSNSCKTIVFFYKEHHLFGQVKSFILSKDRFLEDAFSEDTLTKRIDA